MILTNCKVTEIGKLNGNEIIVATDSAGSNVIIGGHKREGHAIHYLSPTYKNHESAVMMGKRIITMKKIPKRFTNMNGNNGTSRSLGMIGMAFLYGQFENRRNAS